MSKVKIFLLHENKHVAVRGTAGLRNTGGESRVARLTCQQAMRRNGLKAPLKCPCG